MNQPEPSPNSSLDPYLNPSARQPGQPHPPLWIPLPENLEIFEFPDDPTPKKPISREKRNLEEVIFCQYEVTVSLYTDGNPYIEIGEEKNLSAEEFYILQELFDLLKKYFCMDEPPEVAELHEQLYNEAIERFVPRSYTDIQPFF